MSGSRNFRGGGEVRGGGGGGSPMVYFLKIVIFQGSRGAGVYQFFQGGGWGGGQLLIPYTHITCVYSRGTGPLAPSPLDPRMQYLDQLDAVTEVKY